MGKKYINNGNVKLVLILLQTDGIYGGRFSGAGFNGCCMAIIDPEKEESIREYITTEYAKDFVIAVCDTADGVEI